ncbi:MAG TPA: galactokinase family protein [Candidatus Limnocylindria bacterium]
MTSASAPGRVNLIGEHTDYNGGFVLPVALPSRVTVQLTLREDAHVRGVTDANVDAAWIAHVMGPARILGIERGYDVRVTSDLPPGAGLGSSGALGVATIRALREAFGLDLDDVTIAKLAQRSENEFVGASSGIMDQMAASLGAEGEALFIDCRSLAFERIPLPRDMDLVVIHSGVTHQHSSGEYNVRRRQCEEAARALGVAQLRDAGPADASRIDALPEPLSRRARHVVAENARVLGAVAALRERDIAALGELLDDSHRSLRDDYEVSTPEVDLLVELVREQEGIHGARITGGGFGGSIVAIADLGTGHHAAALAVAEYEQRTGLDARILLPALAL